MRSLMKNAGRYWVSLAGLLLLLESSCATMRPIPETDYKAADPARNKTYWLTIKDKRVYEFKKFAVTDSTLVILEVTSYGRSSWPDDMSRIKTPVVIPWDDIKSLERSEHSIPLTMVAIMAGVIVVGSIIYTVVVIDALNGMSGD